MATAVGSVVEDLAREAAIETAGDAEFVGALESVETDADGFTTVRFASNLTGYAGWTWAVALTGADADAAVCESYLLPSDGAKLAPEWVPWEERVRPGDLDAAMVLPYIAEDPRLVPGYTQALDDDLDAMEIFEFGLGRERVLAPEGRDAAADRWYRGSHGPTAASAITSTAQCSTCAFYVPLTGSMRLTFGACTNEWSPSDGRVVSVDHGCGAHSETDAERRLSEWPALDPIIDTDAVEIVDLSEPDPEPEPEPELAPEATEQVPEGEPDVSPDRNPDSEPEPQPEETSDPDPEPALVVEMTPGDAAGEEAAVEDNPVEDNPERQAD